MDVQMDEISICLAFIFFHTKNKNLLKDLDCLFLYYSLIADIKKGLRIIALPL